MPKKKPTKYDSYTKEQLIAKLQKLEKQRYGLVWEDKPEEVAKQCETELPVLAEVKEKAINKKTDGPTHYIIEGDNYHSLYTLNFTHRRKVDFIYIDPPYNTGSSDWKYNNNYVDQNDRFRHSKWLSFMSKRLRLSKSLLKTDGIICVTIDDHELPRLLILMESIFGHNNHLGTTAIRINPGGRKSKRKIAAQHEYAIFFSRSDLTKVAKIYKSPELKSHNYKQDEDGTWYEERNLRKEGADSLAKDDSSRFYPIYYNPETGQISSKKKLKVEIIPIDSKGEKRIWRRAKDDIDKLYEERQLFIKETKFGTQVYFKFGGGLKGETPKSFWSDPKYSASEHGTQILDKILGEREKFNFPKSPYAVKDCILTGTSKKDAVILDFFAGSGTTGQAVLELNKNDGGSRQFILCTNNENEICEEITYPRIHNVITGYSFQGELIEVVYSKKISLSIFHKQLVQKDGESTENFISRTEKIRTETVKKIWEDIDRVLSEYEATYDRIDKKLEKNTINIYGIKYIKEVTEGIPANVKYFKTEFVPAIKTDNDKRVLVAKSTELLCLAEDTFDVVKQNLPNRQAGKKKKDFAVFQNASKLTAIIYDEDSIAKCVAELNKQSTEKETVIYVFSYDHTYSEEDFEGLKTVFTVKPIPEAILNVYRKAQKISKK